MRTEWKGTVSVILASGLVIALLAGVAGIIWRGDKISTQGSVIIGMLVGAVVIIGAAYLGIFLTYVQTQRERDIARRWASLEHEDTLVKPPGER